MNLPNVHASGLQMICWMACRAFGGTDGMFNSAGFSNAWNTATGFQSTLDGGVVEAILGGRDWVVQQPGGGHWKLMSGVLP